MNKPLQIIVLSILAAGCHTSLIDPDYASQANARIAGQEGVTTETPAGTELKNRLLRLWVDRPECIQILTRDHAPETLPRLISSIPPSYPTVPFLANVKARVVVTFVVSDSGKVEEARVYESSDSRFDESALDAVRQWRFLPAIMSGRPTKEIITIPMEFGGRRK